MADYTFDGINFENIEKIGDFPPIINLKNARKTNKRKEYDDCISLIQERYPQLFEFMKKHKESFNNFFKLDNNALLSLENETENV